MSTEPARFLLSLALVLTIANPALAEAKQSQVDRSIEIGQKAFDSGSFAKAERTWLKAQSDMTRTGAADEQVARLLQKLGDCFCKENKFPKAEAAYQEALKILQSTAADQADTLAKLKDLSAYFRSINLEGFDENATAFAKEVGAVCATALNRDDKRHIDISLKQRFQENMQKLIEIAQSTIPGVDDKTKDAALAALNSGEEPAVKMLRLDKQIAFDLVRGDTNGRIKIANIQGISVNVGLWAKLKDFEMSLDEQNKPVAQVTAGAFGVEKTVHVSLPQSLFRRLKGGLDKFDPFATAISQAAPAAGTSATAANSGIGTVNSNSPAAASSTSPNSAESSSSSSSGTNANSSASASDASTTSSNSAGAPGGTAPSSNLSSTSVTSSPTNAQTGALTPPASTMTAPLSQ